MASLLTLTTDFGTRDAYVAAMKGVMLGIAPTTPLVDISHEIYPQDVMEAAFVLRGAVPFFPPGSIHVVVVDPGVGTARRPVALRKGDQWFVGPDNGLFALTLNGEPPDEAVVLDRPEYWRTETPSATFHGRDIFAPVGAHLAAGVPLHDLGAPITDLQRLHWALPIVDSQGVRGWVVHVDRFGNGITNIPQSAFEDTWHARELKCLVGSTILRAIHRTYADVAEGEPLLLFGSSGMLEIAVNGGNASDLLSIRKGASVNLVFLDAR